MVVAVALSGALTFVADFRRANTPWVPGRFAVAPPVVAPAPARALLVAEFREGVGVDRHGRSSLYCRAVVAAESNAMPRDLQANKRNAIAFYRTAYDGEPAAAVERYVGAEYIQHNPAVGDGKQAFIDYFAAMAAGYPGKTIAFVRAVAEGDLFALHTHQAWSGGDEYVTMDFFRFDPAGKIVEHWDAIQPIPGETLNGNPMY